MSFATTISALSSKVDGLIANRVAKFAYTQQAYNSDDVDGVENYDYAEEQNIPLGTASVLKVNETILTKGWRTQASAITRMLMNHFLGRTSYNLNKTVDFLKSLMTAITDNMGVAEGFATLDANGRIPSSQLTEEVMEYKGEWNADTNTPELDEETGKKGDVYKVSVSGTQDLGEGEKYFRAGTYIIFNGTAYTVLSGEDVAKVNNIAPDSVGNVTLTGENIEVSSTDSFSLTERIKHNLKWCFTCLLGRHWENSDLTDRIAQPVYAKGIWVTGTWHSGIKYSFNGRNWLQTNISTGYYNSPIIYANGVFVSAVNGLRYSTDGITWTEVDNMSEAQNVVHADGTWLCWTGAGVKYSNDGINWYDSNLTTSVPVPFSFVRANGLWVACGAAIYYSTDGITWNASNATAGTYTDKVVFTGNLWFACGSGNGIKYSTDGISWNNTNLTSDTYANIIYADGVYVVGCYYGSTGLKYSTDGITWNNSNITTLTYYQVVYANGVWVASGNYANTNKGILYSADGKTWTNSNYTTGGASSIKYSNGVWLLYHRVSASVDPNIKYSTDGKTWLDTALTKNIDRIYFVHGIWFVSTTLGVKYSDIDTLIEKGWLNLD